MEVIKRKDAERRGETVYFTGQPCKHGHTTYRYVKNGACSQCVKEANGSKADPMDMQRRAAKLSMVRVNLRAYVEDRAMLSAAVYATALMRWPFLHESDVDPKLLPADRSGGTGLYAFLCHEEDIGTIREIALGLMRGHGCDVVTRRAQLLGQMLQEANVDTAPPLTFK